MHVIAWLMPQSAMTALALTARRTLARLLGRPSVDDAVSLECVSPEWLAEFEVESAKHDAENTLTRG